jgi:hypothetical protein
MPRGYKACAECNNKKVPIAKKQCECGSVTFLKRNRRKSRNDPRVEGHLRLQNFISRSLQGELSKTEAEREIHVAYNMLEICYGDFDFIAKFTVPSWVKQRNTLLWFKTKDGKKYLERKYNEYLFQPEIKEDIIVDEGELKGENVEYKKKKTLREFLDE